MERALLIIRENIRLLIGAAVVIFTAILIVAILISRNTKVTKVLVNNKTFSVTVAKSDQEKQIGLSKKEKIEENQGMLFIFDNPDYYRFWMKEMKFPIDIIYIKDNKVVTIVENAKPPSSSGTDLTIYQPDDKSDKVLEVKAGLASKYNIKEGTTVKIENL